MDLQQHQTEIPDMYVHGAFAAALYAADGSGDVDEPEDSKIKKGIEGDETEGDDSRN